MTVTYEDARQINPLTLANQISDELQQHLKQAKQERQSHFLIQQGEIAAVGTLAMIIISWGVRRWQKRLIKNASDSIPNIPTKSQPISTLLNQQQQHLQEVKTRLFQTAQAGIWGSGSLIILGLFPTPAPGKLPFSLLPKFPSS